MLTFELLQLLQCKLGNRAAKTAVPDDLPPLVRIVELVAKLFRKHLNLFQTCIPEQGKALFRLRQALPRERTHGRRQLDPIGTDARLEQVGEWAERRPAIPRNGDATAGLEHALPFVQARRHIWQEEEGRGAQDGLKGLIRELKVFHIAPEESNRTLGSRVKLLDGLM